jgi:small subunit ribosomal protein S5
MRQTRDKIDDGVEERTLFLRRVSKKTTGGNYATYSALVAVGDRNGHVGVGLGRGLEVPQALQKATTYARKHMIEVPRHRTTIPHMVVHEYKSSKLLLKPAPDGTGLKVGGVVRVILDLAGIYNASGKLIGSRNQIMNTYAVMEALRTLKPREKSESTKEHTRTGEKPAIVQGQKEEPSRDEMKTSAKPRRKKERTESV